jgi:predicted anti-sigma-YlaC factor YlaD
VDFSRVSMTDRLFRELFAAALTVICLASLCWAIDPSVGAGTPQQVTSPVPGPEQKLTSAEAEILVLKAQLEEMKRSEDRILTTVHWSLGIVGAAALGLAVFSWWSAFHVHERDVALLRDTLEKKLAEQMDTLAARLQSEATQVTSKLRTEIAGPLYTQLQKQQSEGFSYTLTHVADLRLALGDVEGAILAGTQLYNQAKVGNTNYIPHAFDKLNAALAAAQTKSAHLDPPLLQDVRRILREYPDALNDERAIQLKAHLEAFG